VFWLPASYFGSEVSGANYFEIAAEEIIGMPAGVLSGKKPESSTNARFPAILLPSNQFRQSTAGQQLDFNLFAKDEKGASSMTSNNHIEEYLGIDIGSTSLKAVRLAESNEGLVIKGFESLTFPHSVINKDKEIDQKTIIEALASIESLITDNPRHTHSCIALPGFMTTTRFTSIPESNSPEFKKLMQSECQTYCDPESFIFAAKLLERRGNFGEDPDMPKWQRQVLLLMAEKSILDQFWTIAEKTRMPNPNFSVDVLGQIKAFASDEAKSHSITDEKIGIIHVGVLTSSIMVVRNGKLIFVRHMLNDPEKDLIENTLYETERSFAYFYENSGVSVLDQLLISGRFAKDELLRKKASERLALQTNCKSPLQGFASTSQTIPADQEQLFATAIGMAKISWQGWVSTKLAAGFF
jgi:Tfp pilus assembly PilM family ATPase